jgi:RNA polymerase-interacting CarD/CdnL/TRCF family regulator
MVHRPHGAGTVVSILRPDSAPRECDHYQLDLVASNTRLMVPVEGTGTILRPVSSPRTVEELLATIQQPFSSVDAKGRKRQRHQRRLRAGLRTGRARAVAEVICQPRARSQRRSPNFADRRTLRRATAFLPSELAVVEAIPFEQAEFRVERLATS